MNILMLFAVTAGFGLTAWFGTLLVSRLCTGRVPFDDGPRPIAAPSWPFAAVGSVLGIATALHGASLLTVAMLAGATLVLAACAFADLRWGIVPDAFSLPGIVAVGVIAALRHDLNPVVGALFVGLPFAAAAVLSRGRGMGWGDVKFAIFGGALLGARDATLAFCGACVAAYAAAMITRRASQPTALAPYLVAAVAVAIAVDPLR